MRFSSDQQIFYKSALENINEVMGEMRSLMSKFCILSSYEMKTLWVEKLIDVNPNMLLTFNTSYLK